MHTPKALLKFAGKAICSYLGVDLAVDLVFGVFPEVWKDVQALLKRTERASLHPSSRHVAELLLRFGPAALASYDPQAQVFHRNFPVYADVVWRNWSWGKTEEQLRSEVQALLQASPDVFQQSLNRVMDQIAAHEPPLVRKAVAAYLSCIPQKMRSVFRRPQDPTGQFLPTTFDLQVKDSILPFLPTIEDVRRESPSAKQLTNVNTLLADEFGFRLFVLQGINKNAVYRLHEGRNVIGRSVEEPVEIDLTEQENADEVSVSRRHANITVSELALSIEDLNSSNGTFVNHHRLLPGNISLLGVDDILTIGAVKVLVCR